jgi:hypothetical protein
MNYDQMNLCAFNGTAEELKEMLFKYGYDKNNVLAIQNGLDGEYNDGRTTYKGSPADLEAKNKIMDAFRAKTGDFAPQSAESKLAAEYNRMAKQVSEQEKELANLKKQLAEEKTKHRNCPHEWPSIH